MKTLMLVFTAMVIWFCLWVWNLPPQSKEYSRVKCRETGLVCVMDKEGKIIDSSYEKPSPIDTAE